MKRPPGMEALKFQRDMRRNMTEPEKRLWLVVRNRQIGNAKFRKQSWLGPFLVDFFCAEAKLVVEVDGDSHAHQQDYDARRTAWRAAEGFRGIRVSNDDVMRNLEGVAVAIADALTLPLGCAERAPPSPPRGEG